MFMAFDFFELSPEYLRVMQKDRQKKRTLDSRRIIITEADNDYTLSGKKLISVMADLRSKGLPATHTKVRDTLRMYKKTKLAFQGDENAQIYLKNLIPSKRWIAIAYKCLQCDGFKNWDQIEEAGEVKGIYEKKSINLKKANVSAKTKDASSYPILEEIKKFISKGLHVKAYKLIKGVIDDHKKDRASLINCLDELGQANIYAEVNKELRLALRRKDEEIKTANETARLYRKELKETSESLNVAKNKIKELESYIGGLKRQLGDLRKGKANRKKEKTFLQDKRL